METTNALIGLLTMIVFGIAAWLLLKVHRHDKQIETQNNRFESLSATLISQNIEMKASIASLSQRFDIFAKTEIDSLKELIRNFNKE